MPDKKFYTLSERTGKRLNLSKNNLGQFCVDVLSCGADVMQLWAFNPAYKRSAVYPVIKATDSQVEHLRELGYHFVDPPKMVPA